MLLIGGGWRFGEGSAVKARHGIGHTERHWPVEPWNRIEPGLWMGGHLWADGTGTVHRAVVTEEFDLVISLHSSSCHGPAPSVEHLVHPIPDGPLTAPQLGRVIELAAVAADSVRDGRSVLVRCLNGYNRSGLVVAQCLIELGLDSAAAVDLIRARRSPRALSNDVFLQYLTTGLDIAKVLSSLDTWA
ncbi:dual specificity protein phosphatase-like protein [Kitasatospora viridis]|uniref:Dual specificity protein phosphatase-like protein n=1 Tax=Kitasatospora viridis TaxID=281105 RepID=A0A561T6T0_9ACTN|nr:dual specificity protein phosphatase-like protein [Kitasatospora viridis]